MWRERGAIGSPVDSPIGSPVDLKLKFALGSGDGIDAIAGAGSAAGLKTAGFADATAHSTFIPARKILLREEEDADHCSPACYGGIDDWLDRTVGQTWAPGAELAGVVACFSGREVFAPGYGTGPVPDFGRRIADGRRDQRGNGSGSVQDGGQGHVSGNVRRNDQGYVLAQAVSLTGRSYGDLGGMSAASYAANSYFPPNQQLPMPPQIPQPSRRFVSNPFPMNSYPDLSTVGTRTADDRVFATAGASSSNPSSAQRWFQYTGLDAANKCTCPGAHRAAALTSTTAFVHLASRPTLAMAAISSRAPVAAVSGLRDGAGAMSYGEVDWQSESGRLAGSGTVQPAWRGESSFSHPGQAAVGGRSVSLNAEAASFRLEGGRGYEGEVRGGNGDSGRIVEVFSDDSDAEVDEDSRVDVVRGSGSVGVEEALALSLFGFVEVRGSGLGSGIGGTTGAGRERREYGHWDRGTVWVDERCVAEMRQGGGEIFEGGRLEGEVRERQARQDFGLPPRSQFSLSGRSPGKSDDKNSAFHVQKERSGHYPEPVLGHTQGGPDGENATNDATSTLQSSPAKIPSSCQTPTRNPRALLALAQKFRLRRPPLLRGYRYQVIHTPHSLPDRLKKEELAANNFPVDDTLETEAPSAVRCVLSHLDIDLAGAACSSPEHKCPIRRDSITTVVGPSTPLLPTSFLTSSETLLQNDSKLAGSSAPLQPISTPTASETPSQGTATLTASSTPLQPVLTPPASSIPWRPALRPAESRIEALQRLQADSTVTGQPQGENYPPTSAARGWRARTLTPSRTSGARRAAKNPRSQSSAQRPDYANANTATDRIFPERQPEQPPSEQAGFQNFQWVGRPWRPPQTGQGQIARGGSLKARGNWRGGYHSQARACFALPEFPFGLGLRRGRWRACGDEGEDDADDVDGGRERAGGNWIRNARSCVWGDGVEANPRPCLRPIGPGDQSRSRGRVWVQERLSVRRHSPTSSPSASQNLPQHSDDRQEAEQPETTPHPIWDHLSPADTVVPLPPRRRYGTFGRKLKPGQKPRRPRHGASSGGESGFAMSGALVAATENSPGVVVTAAAERPRSRSNRAGDLDAELLSPVVLKSVRRRRSKSRGHNPTAENPWEARAAAGELVAGGRRSLLRC
ncbi:hypothetical protein MBLNU230_g2768t1 [Neophaeotheca triangularis]